MVPMSWPEASFICSTFDVPTTRLSGSGVRTDVVLGNYRGGSVVFRWLRALG